MDVRQSEDELRSIMRGLRSELASDFMDRGIGAAVRAYSAELLPMLALREQTLRQDPFTWIAFGNVGKDGTTSEHIALSTRYWLQSTGIFGVSARGEDGKRLAPIDVGASSGDAERCPQCGPHCARHRTASFYCVCKTRGA